MSALMDFSRAGNRGGDVAARVYKDPRQRRRRPVNLEPLNIPGHLQTVAERRVSDKGLIRPPTVAELIHPGDLMVINSDKADWTPIRLFSRKTSPLLIVVPSPDVTKTKSHAPSIISVSSTVVDCASICTTTTAATKHSTNLAATAGVDPYGWEEELDRKFSAEKRRASSVSELEKSRAHTISKSRKSLLHRVLNVCPRC